MGAQWNTPQGTANRPAPLRRLVVLGVIILMGVSLLVIAVTVRTRPPEPPAPTTGFSRPDRLDVRSVNLNTPFGRWATSNHTRQPEGLYVSGTTFVRGGQEASVGAWISSTEEGYTGHDVVHAEPGIMCDQESDMSSSCMILMNHGYLAVFSRDLTPEELGDFSIDLYDALG